MTEKGGREMYNGERKQERKEVKGKKTLVE